MKNVLKNYRYWMLLALFAIGICAVSMDLPSDTDILAHIAYRVSGFIILAAVVMLGAEWEEHGDMPEFTKFINDALKEE